MRILLFICLVVVSCYSGENYQEVESDGVGADAEATQGTALDILLVFRPTIGDHEMHRAKSMQLAEDMIESLKKLPAKISGNDYRIATLGAYCIQPLIDPNSQPTAESALESALRQTMAERSDSELAKSLPGYNLPGGGDDALQMLMMGLTDKFKSQITYNRLPTEGVDMDYDREVRYTELTPGHLVRQDYDRKPFVNYRQLANGLVAVDYYDQNGKTKCEKPWLRKRARLAIIVIDVLPAHYKGFWLCNHAGMCTMPDIEDALRNSGHIVGNGASLQRTYRLYGMTDKEGSLYRHPYPKKSERSPVAEILPLMKTRKTPHSWWKTTYPKFDEKVISIVDWQDFENYQINGSNQHLVDYLGSVNDEADFEHIFTEIANFSPGTTTEAVQQEPEAVQQEPIEGTCKYRLRISELADVAPKERFSFTVEITDCNGNLITDNDVANSSITLFYKDSRSTTFSEWKEVTMTDGVYQSGNLNLSSSTTGYRFKAVAVVDGSEIAATSNEFNVTN